MFINPKIAIERGWIKGIKDPAKQVQPNAIDFTLDQLFTLNTDTTAFVSESRKVMRQLYPYTLDPAYPLDPVEKSWALEGLRVYDGMSDMYVEVPEGVAAILYTRSTFARNGVFIVSGLYDSGFKGNIGFTIYTIGGPIDIEPGTRIGQIAFIGADSEGVYAGGYNHEQGTHYANSTPSIPRRAPVQKSELAKGLEDASKWNSDKGSLVAGSKKFV